MTTSIGTRLNRSLLDSVRHERAAAVDVPSEELLELPERAVQFGTGNFLRGFLDDFIHRANQQGKFGGRIVAIGSTPSARDASLREQDGLYTLCVEGIENGAQVQQCRIISSLSRAISAADNWAGVLELARMPQLEYVFSNTTEVGIAEDNTSLYEDAPPASYPAKLTRFLFERGQTFGFDDEHGVSVIPCELIENNGTKLKKIVLDIAKRWNLEEAFEQWVSTSVPFCNTLVDRIVPGAPRGENVKRFEDMLGYSDTMLTSCEPYRLFAIEGDDELQKNLTWASGDAGIVVAPDITPYRKRKVHILNGGHTLMVSAALAMGYETVVDAMNDPALLGFVRKAMLEEIVPTLNVDGGREFAEAVIDRFRNPFIKHALIDITLQATMKMKVRVVPSIERYVEMNGTVPQHLAFGFATYLLFMKGELQASRKAGGLSMPVDDQSARLLEHWGQFSSDKELVLAVLSDSSLWGSSLGNVPGFAEAVTEHLARVRNHGVRSALESLPS